MLCSEGDDNSAARDSDRRTANGAMVKFMGTWPLPSREPLLRDEMLLLLLLLPKKKKHTDVSKAANVIPSNSQRSV